MQGHRTFPLVTKLGGWSEVLALLERNGEKVSASRRNHWFRRGLPGEIKALLTREAALQGIIPADADFELTTEGARSVHLGEDQGPTDASPSLSSKKQPIEEPSQSTSPGGGQ